MSFSEERWPKVEEALLQLGVEEIWRIRNIRKKFNEIASMGTSLMPDLTLHNITHSDNLILIFAQLQRKFEFTLGRYEAYLLAASAYLHSLGMFFSEMRFQDEILPDLSALRFCPQDRCDHIGNYPLQGKDIGTQIRLTHHLLSAYRLLKNPPSIFGIEEDDRSYLITLCRGHRKVDLREQGCGCYRPRMLGGEVIRLALLAALLRISDALDFYRNRVPAPVFKYRALDFLRNPAALEHWLKHYFVTDPFITRRDESGNISLECIVNFAVPKKQINGRSYLDFFTPLFKKHVAEANATDLDIRQYPPDLINALNIVSMKVTLGGPDERAGFRDLPVEIIERIEQSQCENVMTFLEWLPTLEEGFERVRSSKSLVEIILRGNLSSFTSEKQSAIVGDLAYILNISRDQIKILKVRGGSIILQIEMPTEAVNRLIALYEADDPILKGLEFQQVKKILLGKYKILKRLGSGALGDVYLTEDMDLKRNVAVKHLKSEYAVDEEALERFRREARTIAGLRHPNIAIVYDLVEEDGQSYVIMEYAEKDTLAGLLEREGPLPIIQAIDLTIALCRALAGVHRQEIFHQDIKPNNILLIKSEDEIVPRLSDFGLSGVSRGGLYSRLQYAPPEQLREEPPVDARSDIYSLGIVLYEMLTGSPPFAGTVEDVHRAQLEQEPPLPSNVRRGVQPSLERVVLKALSKKPEDRYQTAQGMAEDLEIARQEELKKEEQIHNLYTQAKQYISGKDWLKAVEMLEAVSALDPNYKDTAKLLEEVRIQISLRLQLLYDQASALFAGENWQEAMEKFQEILALDLQYKDASSKAEEAKKQARLQTLYTDRGSMVEQLRRARQAQVGVVEERPTEFAPWFLSLSCPSRVVEVGRVVQAVIRLSRHSHARNEIVIPGLGAQVFVQIGADGLALQSERVQAFVLPEGQTEELHREIELVALRPGHFRLTAVVSGTQVEMDKSTDVTISVHRSKSQELPELPSPLGPRPGRQPDLTTRVYVTPLDEAGLRYRLSYIAFSPLSRLRLPGAPIGSVDVSATQLAQIRAQLAQIASTMSSASPASIQTGLSTLGKRLYQTFFPSEAHKLYREVMAANIQSWLILCEAEPWIPWELVKPFDDSGEDDFLGARFAVTRFIEGLGTPLQYEFPLGRVSLTLDERLRPRYQPGEWEALFTPGVMPRLPSSLLHESGEGYILAMQYASPVWGLHLEGVPDTLAQSAGALMVRETQQMLSEESVQEATLDFWSKCPLITFGMVTLDGQSALTDMERQWVPTFVKAGVGTFVGTLWTTDPRVDRLFWSAFYRAIWARRPLGEAVSAARQLVRSALPDSMDWLAYFAVGDPMARGYVPKWGEGYASLECVSHDLEQPLRLDERYEFYAKLEHIPPVSYHGRRHRTKPAAIQVPRLMVFAPEFDVEPDRWLSLARQGNHFEQRFWLRPRTVGQRDLFVKFLEGDEMLQTIDFTVEVEGGGRQ